MAFPSALTGALAESGTPDSNPPESVPTETTAPEPTQIPVDPTATDIPDEPTATDVPVEPSVTTEPSVEPKATDVPTQTATTEPESDFQAAAVIFSISVAFEVCEDDDQVGTADLAFDGSFGAADTAIQCQAADGVDVTLTDVTGVNGPYTVNLPSGSTDSGFPFATVEEGTYTVSYAPTGAASFDAGSFTEQLVLDDPNDSYYFEILVFIAEADPTDPLEPGTGAINGEFVTCRDAERDEETDFLVEGFTIAGEADLCETSPFDGQVQLTIVGEDTEGNPVGPFTENVFGSSFYFNSIPFGTYTITESVYGNTSEPFVHQNNSFFETSVSIRNFYAVEPVYGISFVLNVEGCSDPERVGTADYLVTDYSEFGAAESCTENFFPAGAPFEITIFDAEGEVFGTYVVPGPFSSAFVPGLTAGTYTMQLSGYDASTSFTVEDGGAYDGRVVIYDDLDIGSGEPDPEGQADIGGVVLYCTAPDISNTTQYQISGSFFPASTSECVDAPTNTGIVYL